MSQQQSVHEFDENFFSSIAVPKIKDYSRLSSSPSRDQPCDSSYFEKHFPNLECDTPVKMRLPTAERDSGDALPPSIDLLSSSSSSDNTTVHCDQRDSREAKQQQQQPVVLREPLKIVPNEETKPYGESELIDGIAKLSMFNPKAPEERLSQRRRSEQKKKQEEENKRRSGVTATSGTSASRARSASLRRSASREPTTGATGVVTRAMARAAQETAATSGAKPPVRRSVMPMRIAQKTPVAVVRDATAGEDRSRDRTRRTNTTGASSAPRRSVLKPSTPVAPPRRSGSVTKTTPANRPMATANRSSMLRMSASKATAAADTTAKTVITRPAVPAATGVRNRVPLRVNPATPSAQPKKPVVSNSGQRPVRPAAPPVRAQSVERGTKPIAATPSKVSREDVFNRLSLPKKASTPSRPTDEKANTSIRKSAVRPVPSYVRSFTKDGLPSSGGLHGIRAPSKTRENANKSTTSSGTQQAQ